MYHDPRGRRLIGTQTRDAGWTVIAYRHAPSRELTSFCLCGGGAAVTVGTGGGLAVALDPAGYGSRRGGGMYRECWPPFLYALISPVITARVSTSMNTVCFHNIY